MRSRCTLPVSSLFLLVLIALIAAGCALVGGGSRTGTLSLYLTDAPVDDLKEVNVTITKVQVHRDGRWEVVREYPEGLTVNLLDLRFQDLLLGQATLPAGAYTQIRLYVDDSTVERSNVVDHSGAVWPLDVPSGPQSGLKIHHNFVVPHGGAVHLLLDVNVRKFVVKSGASGYYRMNPTAIRVVDKTAAGAVTGRVLDAETGEPIRHTDVVVTLWRDDDRNGRPDTLEPVAETLALREDVIGEDGTFRPAGSFQLNGVPERKGGSYLLQVTAEGYAPWERTGIVVSRGTIVEIDGEPSTSAVDPILLQPAP